MFLSHPAWIIPATGAQSWSVELNAAKAAKTQEDQGYLRFVFLVRGSQPQLWKKHQDPSVVTSSAWQAARAKHRGCQNTVLFCEEHQVPAEEEIAGLPGV